MTKPIVVLRRDNIIRWLLIALAFCIPLVGRTHNISKYLFFLLFIAWLIRGNISFRISIFKPTIVYLMVIVLSIITGVAPEQSILYFLKHTIMGLMIFVIADCVRDRTHFRTLIKYFLMSAGIVSLVGILQAFSSYSDILLKLFALIGIRPPFTEGLGLAFVGRITSTRGHPVVFAENIILYLSMMITIALYHRQKGYILGVFILFIALVLTYSRMPIFAFIITCSVAGINFYKKLNKGILLPILALLTIFGILLVFNSSSRSITSLNLGGRELAWKAGYQIALERPMFGLGIGNIPETYYRVLPNPPTPLAHLHNTYLQIAASTGIYGLIAFLWLLYIFFRELLRRIKSSNEGSFEKYILVGLLFGFLAEGMCGMTDDLFCRAEIYYPIYFLMGLAMSRALAPKNS